MLGKGVCFAIGNITFGTKHFEAQIKDLVQLPVPVVDQSCRNNHERTIEFTSTGQFAENERCFDGFSQSYFIGNKETPWRCGGDAVREHNLMRQQVNPGGGEGRSAFHDGQGMCFIGEPCLTGSISTTIDGTENALKTRAFLTY